MMVKGLCPFCSYKDAGEVITNKVTPVQGEYYLVFSEHHITTWYHVECTNCKACGPRSEDRDKAVELWRGGAK